jgi:hypothetical protein
MGRAARRSAGSTKSTVFVASIDGIENAILPAPQQGVFNALASIERHPEKRYAKNNKNGR